MGVALGDTSVPAVLGGGGGGNLPKDRRVLGGTLGPGVAAAGRRTRERPFRLPWSPVATATRPVRSAVTTATPLPLLAPPLATALPLRAPIGG